MDATTGKPLAQAAVKGADGSTLATTDATGQFAIPKLPADKDKLTVAAPGFQAVALPLSKEAAKAIQLQPRLVSGTLTDSETGQPMAGKLVLGGDGAVVTDETGKFSFAGLADGAKLKVELVGYQTLEQAVDATTSDFKLSARSTSFNGSLTDAKTGKPITSALIKTLDNSQSSTSGQDGKFSFSDLKRDDNTSLKVKAPGYKVATFKATELAKGVKMEPFYVRAIYVPGIFAIRANYDDLFAPYLKMGDNGEANAIVVDMKWDDTGQLWYDSQIPIAKELGLVKDKGTNKDTLIDIPKLLDDAHKHNLYVIARYVVMRDPAIAKARPEWALKNNRTGGSWQDKNQLVWPNAFVPEVGNYNASIAKELAGFGFDEIQWDYIRFPTDGVLKEIQYKPDLSWGQLSDNEKLRTDTIEGLVKKGWDNLHQTDTFFSLDVFGMSLWREDDNNIGQQYNNLVMISDYICPMVYPTHFETGTLDQKQYPGPTGNYPGVIISKSGVIANKLEAQLKPHAKYRPWLEDFGLGSVKHTPERLRLQIVAAEENGASGWSVWNARGVFSEQVLAQTSKSR